MARLHHLDDLPKVSARQVHFDATAFLQVHEERYFDAFCQSKLTEPEMKTIGFGELCLQPILVERTLAEVAGRSLTPRMFPQQAKHVSAIAQDQRSVPRHCPAKSVVLAQAHVGLRPESYYIGCKSVMWLLSLGMSTGHR